MSPPSQWSPACRRACWATCATGNDIMINIGVVGYGYWGPNLVRNFADLPQAAVAAIADADPCKLACAQRRYPAARTMTDAHELLRDPAVDAVAIATPVGSHFELG